MSKMTQQLAQSIGTVLPPSDAPFCLNVSSCSHFGLLALYGLAKTYKHKKPLFMLELIERKYPEPNQQFSWFTYFLGFLIGFTCFLELESVTINYINGAVQANKLPAQFEEYIVRHINARIKQGSGLMKRFLQEGKLEIDNYFVSAA